ncbi:hypothetical protein PFISCL1PPCAC_20241, partial [Pristionchus fissidentatus]
SFHLPSIILSLLSMCCSTRLSSSLSLPSPPCSCRYFSTLINAFAVAGEVFCFSERNEGDSVGIDLHLVEEDGHFFFILSDSNGHHSRVSLRSSSGLQMEDARQIIVAWRGRIQVDISDRFIVNRVEDGIIIRRVGTPSIVIE